MHYDERFVKSSRKNRRCEGCEGFVTIAIGDPYWSCWYADGGDAGRYAMCVACHDHLYGGNGAEPCKSCNEYLQHNGTIGDVRECIRESSIAQQEVR